MNTVSIKHYMNCSRQPYYNIYFPKGCLDLTEYKECVPSILSSTEIRISKVRLDSKYTRKLSTHSHGIQLKLYLNGKYTLKEGKYSIEYENEDLILTYIEE